MADIILRPKEVQPTDDFLENYKRDFDSVQTISELETHLKKWQFWYSLRDRRILAEIKPEQIRELIEGRRLERQRINSRPRISSEAYQILLSLLCPEHLFRVWMVAKQYLVPISVAFRRLCDLGYIEFDGDEIVWKKVEG